MGIKRLFIAVDLPLEVRETLHELGCRVLKKCDSARPVKTNNMHITLKFLGDVRSDDMNLLNTAISGGILSFKSFTFEIDGKIDAFPDKKRARTLFTGIGEGKQELQLLYLSIGESLERVCDQFNTRAGRKDYIAHITLARFSYPEDISEAIDEAGTIIPFRISVRNITLFESILGPGGARYTKLKEFSLK